jgi:superfamily II DNA or RNA helicase
MKEPVEVQRVLFDDGDRLRLLQLMTRRAMAERLQREGAALDDEESPAELGEAGAEPAVPEHWRLTPEGLELYKWQKECLPLWLEKGRGTVKVATGGGKTLFALAAAQRLQNEREPDLRLVIVVPTIPLMHQWHDEVRAGNLPDEAIGLMGGGRELPPTSQIRVLICVLNSARERLPALVRRAGWAGKMMLVVDECHRANAERAKRIFTSRPAYTLGLSATPEQDAAAEGLPTDKAYNSSPLGRGVGPIIYDFGLKQSMEAGLLTPFEVWHVGVGLSVEESAEHARLSREISDLRKELQRAHRSSRSKLGLLAWCQVQAARGGASAAQAERFIGLANNRKRLLYRAVARRQLILGALEDAARDPEGRTILFHESIGEIEILYLEASAVGLPVALEHSRLPDGLRAESIDAFRQGVARIIISAKSLVEGFNVPSADLGIIAASSSSIRQRIQSLGRMLRRKGAGRTARIVVLYVRDTEDEAIYEKADWEQIIGVERNRYFSWSPSPAGEPWMTGLVETGEPPRQYLPPSWEVDVGGLKLGDPYPGRPEGVDLKVDQSDNLRTEDGVLVKARRQVVDAIVARNVYRRARRTPAGHLIVRTSERAADTVWSYVGRVALPAAAAPSAQVIRLRLKSASGRRVIAREEPGGRVVKYALGPVDATEPERGAARDELLRWIADIERQRGMMVRDLFWDGQASYWLESAGERIPHEGPLAPLEFKE